MESALSLWPAEREGADQKPLEDTLILVSVAEEQKDRVTQRKAEPCVEQDLVAHMHLGSNHLFCLDPFLKSLQAGDFFWQKKKKERTVLAASTLLPKLPLAFQISEFLGALGPDTSE